MLRHHRWYVLGLSFYGIILFGTIAFAETPEATVRNKLKPVILSLFSDAHLQTTQNKGSKEIVPRTSHHKFNYVLTNVKKIVSEKDMEAYNQQFDDFLRWARYWDLYTDAKIESIYHGFPSEKQAKDDSPNIIPGLRYYIRGEKEVYFQLHIDFVNRPENTLIVMCNLLLTIPPPVDADLEIGAPRLTKSRLENGRYQYEISFDLTNKTDHAINVPTNAFSKSWTQDHGIANILLYLRSWNRGDNKYPSLNDIKIITLRSGASHQIKDSFSNDKEITKFILTYRPDDIFDGSGNYWIGSVKTKLIQVEQGAEGDAVNRAP